MVSVPLLVVALQVLAVLAIYPADADGGAWSGEADEGAAAASAGDPDKRKGEAADQIIVAGKGKEPASQLQRIRIRHGRSGSDGPRGNAAMAFAEGAAKGPEICLALPGSPLWVQKKKLWRSLRCSRGGSEGSVVKDNEASWLGKGAADRDIEAGTSNNREEHHYPQPETTFGAEDGSLTACMLRKPQEGKSQNSDHSSNHTHHQVPKHADLHGETNVVNLLALDNSLVQRGSLTVSLVPVSSVFTLDTLETKQDSSIVRTSRSAPSSCCPLLYLQRAWCYLPYCTLAFKCQFKFLKASSTPP